MITRYCIYIQIFWRDISWKLKLKYKKLTEKQKVHQYCTINSLIRLRIEESGQAKIITHMVDLQNLFPDIEVDSL